MSRHGAECCALAKSATLAEAGNTLCLHALQHASKEGAKYVALMSARSAVAFWTRPASRSAVTADASVGPVPRFSEASHFATLSRDMNL